MDHGAVGHVGSTVAHRRDTPSGREPATHLPARRRTRSGASTVTDCSAKNALCEATGQKLTGGATVPAPVTTSRSQCASTPWPNYTRSTGPRFPTAAPSSAPALRVPRLARCGSASPSGWRSPPARRQSWPRRVSAGASRAGHAAPAPRVCGRRRHGRGPSWSARATGSGRPVWAPRPLVRARGSVAWSRRPITPFMGPLAPAPPGACVLDDHLLTSRTACPPSIVPSSHAHRRGS